MSSPAPLLRPPIPGGRQQSSSRAPRLGLSIPPSPNAKPVSGASPLPALQLQQPSRPALPQLRLATPMGSNSTPHEQLNLQNGRPQLQLSTGQSASGSSDNSAARSRAGSFGALDGRGSGPASAGSQLSQLSSASQHAGSSMRDPASAVGSMYSERGSDMEREGSLNGMPDISQLSLEKGKTADVEDLDDAGWHVASAEGRIEELGSLGEGAGGAVTRCKLKGGTTFFALKVSEV